ncbi:MAG TPA: PVC-type heme-binding CxxCH protein [Pirellulales bacterium]|nr:PVC-type heme-binding CxxCH protein [Pirellulales bacterium]
MHSALFLFMSFIGAAPAAEAPPRSLDPRVVIEEFAAQPDIVTPTGLAVDEQGRVLVAECHTHFRPPDYAGPPADRIRMLVDTDNDGRADRVTNFYEGGTATMNLAVYEDGSVFVATRMDIHRLSDRDSDGVSDDRKLIARLETAGNYPHNGLSGFAFDGLGNVYFGLGENLGADYRLIGADGTTLSGGGEGGSIYRCRPDGSQLVRLATGFWNPFHLCCDAFDRLFAVDNDPDSRPPCRLLHVVPGGDYGYRFRNGRKGVHPFTAWNGELPGTLPMTAGTGEAPSGVLAYDSDMLPEEFRGTLLVTSWGDHRIERFRLVPHGASFRATAEPVITGGENFRPVGIALAPDGSLFVSDWVDKSYELHGQGRVWHIRNRDGETLPRLRDARHSRHRPDRQAAIRRSIDNAKKQNARSGASPEQRLAVQVSQLTDIVLGKDSPAVRADALIGLARADHIAKVAKKIAERDASPDLRALATRLGVDDVATLGTLESDKEAEVRAEALRRLVDPHARPLLLKELADQDPFIAQAARSALARSTNLEERLQLTAAESAPIRLAAILLLRESSASPARAPLAKLLADPDATVRFAAVQWVAEAGLSEYREQIANGLASGATTRSLFEAYLAALERLDGRERKVKDEWSGEQYVLSLIENPDTAPAVRARALRTLRADHPALTIDLLTKLAAAPDLPTRVEAIRSLRERQEPEARDEIERLAADGQAPVELRAEAIVGITADTEKRRELLLALADTDDSHLRREALRSLRGAVLSASDRARLAALRPKEADHEMIGRLLGEAAQSRPPRTDGPGWAALISADGDPASGERIFFHPRGPACYRCHQMDGRGGSIGPELSVTPRALSPARLLESLLVPSKEIAPQFTSWTVIRHDGTTFSGIMLSEGPDGTRQYGTPDGQTITVRDADVAEVRTQPKSIMPDDLCVQMTPAELADLVAFLRGAK